MTTKASEDENKFDKVHTYLLKGECSKEQNLDILQLLNTGERADGSTHLDHSGKMN